MNALVPLGTILKLYLTLFFTSGMKRLHSMRYFGYHSWREIINTSTNMIIFSLTPLNKVSLFIQFANNDYSLYRTCEENATKPLHISAIRVVFHNLINHFAELNQSHIVNFICGVQPMPKILIKASFKPPVRLSCRALKQVWKQVG